MFNDAKSDSSHKLNQSCSLKGNQTGKVKVDSKTLKVDYEFGYPLSF